MKIQDLTFDISTDFTGYGEMITPVINGYLESVIINAPDGNYHCEIYLHEFMDICLFDIHHLSGQKYFALRTDTISDGAEKFNFTQDKWCLNNQLHCSIEGTFNTSVTITIRYSSDEIVDNTNTTESLTEGWVTHNGRHIYIDDEGVSHSGEDAINTSRKDNINKNSSLSEEEIKIWNKDSIDKNTYYHGTNNPEVLKKEGVKDNFGTENGWLGPGFYMAQDSSEAQRFGKPLETHVNIKKVKEYNTQSEYIKDATSNFKDIGGNYNDENFPVFRNMARNYNAKLKSEGYDAIKFNQRKWLVVINKKSVKFKK